MVLEHIVLGAVQGVTEWLPLSSEGLLVLVQLAFGQPTTSPVSTAIFLHLGTLLAAVVYFRHTIRELIHSCLRYHQQEAAQQKLIQFLLISTVVSGLVGGIMYSLLTLFPLTIEMGAYITLAIAVFLFITAGLHYITPASSQQPLEEMSWPDSALAGVAQAFAVIPGISRSGITVAALLLQKYEKATALRLSFLMSIPAVLGANIVLQLDQFTITPPLLVGLVFAFLTGLMTIHGLLQLAERLHFGRFVLLFAVLTLIAGILLLV